jgi:hypothetical protein
MVMSPAALGPENDCAGEEPTATAKDRTIFSSERTLRKGYNRKCSVGK